MNATSSTYTIDIRDLTVTLGTVKVLDKVTTRIEAGHITALIGPNGSGKTTLLRAILNRVPYEGEIRFVAGDGAATAKNPPVIGYVPQHFEFDRAAPLSVRDFLMMDLQRRPLWIGIKASEATRATAELERVGGAALIKKRLGALSGGELQRVLLAKALLRSPDILLLDEPVSGVDIAGEELFCDLLENLQKAQKFTLAMISHDLSVVSRHADRVICINHNLICQGNVTEVITQENIQKIYGVHMGFHQHHHHGHDHT